MIIDSRKKKYVLFVCPAPFYNLFVTFYLLFASVTKVWSKKDTLPYFLFFYWSWVPGTAVTAHISFIWCQFIRDLEMWTRNPKSGKVSSLERVSASISISVWIPLLWSYAPPGGLSSWRSAKKSQLWGAIKSSLFPNNSLIRNANRPRRSPWTHHECNCSSCLTLNLYLY